MGASPFAFKPGWASIISGFEEGLFGWVAVNFLLGTLSGGNATSAEQALSGPSTSGIIDLGGGSVQLAYAVPPDFAPAELFSGNVSFAGQVHRLHVRSHLHFGLDEARASVGRNLVRGVDGEKPVVHPCLPLGHKAPLGSGLQSEFVGSGDHESCVNLYANLFRNTGCEEPPCLRPDASQAPPMPASILGFSYIYDRTRGVGLLDGDCQLFGNQTASVAQLREATARLCALSPTEAQRRATGCGDSEKWPNFCGDAVYITELLERGFGIDPSRPLTMANKVAGVELVWTLGAIIANANALAQRGERDEL